MVVLRRFLCAIGLSGPSRRRHECRDGNHTFDQPEFPIPQLTIPVHDDFLWQN